MKPHFVPGNTASSEKGASKVISAGGQILKPTLQSGHKASTLADASKDPSAGGQVQQPHLIPGTPNGQNAVSPLFSRGMNENVGVLFVHGDEIDLTSPSGSLDPLELSSPLVRTPQILPDVIIEESFSPIEDWSINLSKTTPSPREISVLPDIVTPPQSNSPFWISPGNELTKSALQPRPISLACSPTTTPHGPTTYFSKKLRQKVLLSQTKKNSRSSSSKKSSTISTKTQKFLATQVAGIARLDLSSNNLPSN